MNHPPVISQSHLQQAFEHLGLSLWAVFYQYGVPDEVIWEASKYVHKAYVQIEEKLLPQAHPQEDAELHPAVRELLRKIRKS